MVYTRDAQPAVHGPDPARERVISSPQSNLKKYKKWLQNDGDFMNKIELYWIPNNFAT